MSEPTTAPESGKEQVRKMGIEIGIEIEVSHAWLQKHPTPAASGGEFHWYGAGSSASAASPAGAASPATDDAQLRGRVVEQLQGMAAPSVWWELAPGQVIWASVFSAISPTDARPYRGVALTVVRGRASAQELLARWHPAPPRPWSAEAAARPAEGARALADGDGSWCRPAELARAMMSGGPAAVADPHEPALPARLAELVRWLPAQLAERPRSGQLRLAAESEAAGAASDDALAQLLAAVWRAEGMAARRARAAWTLVQELTFGADDGIGNGGGGIATAGAARRTGSAEARLQETLLCCEEARVRGQSPDALLRWLGAEASAGWLRHHRGAPASWPRLLHGWGRGWLDENIGEDWLARCADELALRALAALCSGGAASQVVAEVRWHALLPAGRRRALLQALARRAPSLENDRFGPRPRRGSPVLQEESADVA